MRAGLRLAQQSLELNTPVLLGTPAVILRCLWEPPRLRSFRSLPRKSSRGGSFSVPTRALLTGYGAAGGLNFLTPA